MTNQSAPKPAAPAFTPGPWTMYPMLTASENDRGFRVKAYDGRDAWTWIADVSPVIKDDSGDASEEGVANARLIAAAPDLLDACRAAEKDCDRIANDVADGNIADIAEQAADIAFALRAAIAKAEGGQS